MSPPRLTAELVAVLRSVLPRDRGSLPLHEPSFGGAEWRYIKDCLDSGWVSSAGSYVETFEQKLAETTGAGQAVATVNGTAALHLCLIGAGVQEGEEVIAPALTFVASINAIAYCGAVPHFADCDASDLGLDAAKLAEHLDEIGEARDDGFYNRQSGRRIAAVLVTHVLGHAADLEPLAELCRSRGLPLIEDAAEALGSRYKGRHVGNHGLVSALSFNGNKIMTTGGGGAVLTSDEDLADRLKHLSTTARPGHPWRYDHDAVGYNYRLPNINAALGCAQLEQLRGFLESKRRLADRYRLAFGSVTGVTFFAPPREEESNHWLNALLLDQADQGLLDDCLAALHAEGILARPLWTPMHKLAPYSDAPCMDLSVVEDIAARLICLPSSARLA